MGLVVLLGSLLLAAGAFGAADGEELGKGEGYPLCPAVAVTRAALPGQHGEPLR
jgi:hypothetical protein